VGSDKKDTKGCEVPCLERGSGTLFRHWAKRVGASGADESVDILTSVSERKKGETLCCYYVRKADVFTTFWHFCQKFTKKLVDGLTCSLDDVAVPFLFFLVVV
jgi:hypothetical protein